MQKTMRVALFVTCLVDLMRPEIGIATLALLEAAGCEVSVPQGQTCCGQPGYNSGERATALHLAREFVRQFEGYDYIVLPSGSCTGMIKLHYDELLKDEPEWRARMLALRDKIYELSQFLQDVACPPHLPLRAAADMPAHLTYHDSCSGLRELGIAQQARKLLAQLPGVQMSEMRDCSACCGFGGTFSVKYAAISAAIADEKCVNIQASGAQAVVLGDLGCILNIEGRLRQRGDHQTRVLHFAQMLAGPLASEERE